LLLTTHDLDEADTMAERVVIIDHGRIIADDTPEALKQEHAGDRLMIATDPGPNAERLAAHLRAWESTTAVTVDEGSVVATVTRGSRRIPELVHLAEAHEIPVLDLQVRRPTLDDVFLTLTGRSLREAAAETEEVAA
ncbi:MAG: DUF4162 domain-containing protein, partial [Mobilicoccus sp.]|nr:DUF4162 domain-containing protein [Mobilicoccus sp.]